VRPNAIVRPCLIAAVLLVSVTVPAASAGAGDAYPGRLDVRHSDDFAGQKTSTRYTLRESRDRRYTVRTATPPNVPSGSQVIVRGVKRGGVIRGDVRARPGVRAAGAGVLGDYKTAVLLVNFTNDRSQPWAASTVRDRFFGTGSSVDTFFKEQSWNQVDLSGDVYGWYELAQSSSTSCSDPTVDAWAAEADQKARDSGVPLASFDSIAYVFPRQNSCGWAGLAELPGNQLWLNGDITVRVASHELGHNMGVHHAASLACSNNGVGVQISSTCTMSEYGDPFSTMGNVTRRMAGWHLQQLGYLAASNVRTVTTNGTYALRTSLSQTTDPVLLKIPRSPATDPAEYYYVDLRAAGGVFDNFGIADPAIKGVTIRVGNATTVRNQSKLIDTTPDSNANSAQDFFDAPLAPGRTFSDGKVSITTTSVAGGVATVDVTWDGPAPDSQAPSAPAITDATHYGSYVDLSWSAATDNAGVAGYRVKRNGATLATVTTTSYRDSNVYSGGSYSYCIEAFDAAGNARSSGCVVPVRYVPPAPPPPPPPPPGDTGATTPPPPSPPPSAAADLTAPVVKLIAPGRNARLRSRATVRAAATDAGGVEVIEFWVDNVRLATRRGHTLNLKWQLKRIRPGKHKVMVLARDAAGNTGKRRVTVRVRR
jgi:hypothetical protein